MVQPAEPACSAMANRRVPVRIEFLTTAGARMEFDADGWRLVRPRTMGEKDLQKARALLAKAEETVMPVDPARLVPPDLLEIAEYVAKVHTLRITHRHFRQR